MLRLRDFCDIYLPRPLAPAPHTAASSRFVSGRDLFRETLVAEEIEERPAPDHLPREARLRPGDILVPRVTRHPCARLVGANLAGCYAHHTIAIIRPRPGSMSLQRLAGFLSSARFLSAVQAHTSTFAGAVRLTVQALADTVLEEPGAGELPSASVTLLMDRVAREIVRIIATHPGELRHVEWRMLERVIAEALEGLGFDVELTPSSKDGGKDIVLSCVDAGVRRQYVVEIKHWISGKRVGGGHLRKFVEVVVNGRHDRGLLLSTSGFAATAREGFPYIEHGRVRTAGHEKIVDLCKMYVRGESGLWIPDLDSSDLLFAGTT